MEANQFRSTNDQTDEGKRPRFTPQNKIELNERFFESLGKIEKDRPRLAGLKGSSLTFATLDAILPATPKNSEKKIARKCFRLASNGEVWVIMLEFDRRI